MYSQTLNQNEHFTDESKVLARQVRMYSQTLNQNEQNFTDEGARGCIVIEMSELLRKRELVHTKGS